MKYVIQYGLSPYFQDLLQRHHKGKPFLFKFDETTTSQTKKHTFFKKNVATFYGWGSAASRLEPLRGGSLLFTARG